MTGSPSLTQQVAEKLGPDGVWRELHPFIKSLPPPQDGKVEVKALCPFHDDHHPSWCWSLEKGIATCHVCGEGNYSIVGYIARCTHRRPIDVLDDYCKRLGLPRPHSRTLTLADYAQAKALPIEFLAERFALFDEPDGLHIPYLAQDGEQLALRRRAKLGGKPMWKGKGTPARRMVYGLHGLPWIAPTGYIFVVEGESDLHTAWFYDFPALALPGAHVGHRALAKVIRDANPRTVYVLPDDDPSGRLMLKTFDRELKLAGWTEDFRSARLPAKDLSELHVKYGDQCQDAIYASLHRALPVEEVLVGLDAQKEMEDSKMVEVTDRIFAIDDDLIPTDKLILIRAAREVAGDLTQPIPMAKKRLAAAVGVARRTMANRLPHLCALGYLVDDGHDLRFGPALVQ